MRNVVGQFVVGLGRIVEDIPYIEGVDLFIIKLIRLNGSN